VSAAGSIHVGVGGWTFEPWRAVFYPAKWPQAKELNYAGQQLTGIEINGTFYSSRKPASFIKWRDAVPEGFVFTVKANRFCVNRRVLAEATTLEEAAPAILRAVCEGLQWDVGVLWRVDAHDNRLHCVDVWHAADSTFKAFVDSTRSSEFSPDDGLPGRIWSSGGPQWVPDVTKDRNFPRAKMAVKNGLHGAFGFPIRIQDQILGVIEFFSRAIREPKSEILEMFATIGSQMGQSIERKAAEQAIRKLNADLETRVMDATAELRKSQADLQHALEQEREYSRLKSNFVTLVSHEFRTPLGVILSSAEMLDS
jgi:transcriptional regulator with GAF, ATPase, and Fis domain